MSAPRLVLGTAQFGMPYGVMNTRGQCLSPADAAATLALARDAGVDVLDTAISYGHAEQAIASAWPSGARFAVVNKLPAIQDGARTFDAGQLVAWIERSLQMLPIARFHAVLAHHAPDLLGSSGDQLYKVLEAARTAGLTQKIGASVYDPETLTALFDRYDIGFVQLPMSVLDQRFARADVVAQLKRRGVEVHVRSVLLQGILVADIAALPKRFASVAPVLKDYGDACRRSGLTPLASALNFISRCDWVDGIVIGVDGPAQLRENIEAYRDAAGWTGSVDFTRFAVTDPDIIDPRRWQAAA